MRMRPIFLGLVTMSFIILGITFSFGWRFHAANSARPAAAEQSESPATEADDATGLLLPKHLVWGMAAGVFVCFVHSIVLVYFLGTSKAIKEQMELQNWDAEMHDRARRIMSRALFPAAGGIITVIVAALSGGVTLVQAISPDVHMMIAATGIAAQIPIYMIEYGFIRENGRLLDEVLDRLGTDQIAFRV